MIISRSHITGFVSPIPLNSQPFTNNKISCRTPITLKRIRSTALNRTNIPMATVATDEITEVLSKDPELGQITSMSRAGSSGWAVMHRATTSTGKRLFIKVSREDASMFNGEAIGLDAMYQTSTINVPRVYHRGPLSSVSGSFIAMDALDMRGIYDQKQLGSDLARLHLAQPIQAEAKNGKFGFSVDNTIGATPQPNGWMDNWVDFFRERRLRHQVVLTGDGDLIRKGNQLCDRLDYLFEDIVDEIRPSLIHGDLWSGNVNGLDNQEPVIFDPACYYAHHEAEFGMSWCMDFSSAFWEGYREIIPEAPGFRPRKQLYMLYHYLNHYNLFGGSYYYMADRILSDLLQKYS